MIRASATVDMGPAEGLTKGGMKKAVRIGLSRATAPVKAAVVGQAEAVKRFGFLGKSIRIRVRQYPADRWVSVVGPSSKFTRTKGKFKRGARKGQARKFIPAKYAHLVNKGTRRSAGRHWLDRAHAASAPGFIRRAEVEVGRELELELQRRQAAAGGGR